MPKSEFDTDGHLPVCICVCGHLCVCVCVCLCICVCVDICLCIRVCGHLSVCVCVDICHVCTCPSVCCVFMRVRGHLRVCASVCVRERVDMYVQVCVITICNVNVCRFYSYHYCSIWHGYTVHNDMESMV